MENAELVKTSGTVSGNDLLIDGSEEVAADEGGSLSYDVMYTAVYDALVDAQAASQTVTDGQAVNSTALNYFEGILGNSFLPRDYVIYVGDAYTYNQGYNQRTAYEYCMAYGNLELNGTTFTGTATICTIRTSGDVSVSYKYDQTINLDAPLYYSRSNLGDYSGAIQYDWSGFLILLSLFLGGVVWFMRKLLRVKY